MSMRSKILVPICTAVVIVFIATMTITGMRMSDTLKRDAEKLATAVSKDYGSEIGASVEKGMESARTIASFMGGAKEVRGVFGRKKAIAMLRSVLEESPHLDGIWTVWKKTGSTALTVHSAAPKCTTKPAASFRAGTATPRARSSAKR